MTNFKFFFSVNSFLSFFVFQVTTDFHSFW
jgi:hypothetical protein